MNNSDLDSTSLDCSALRVEILIEESWINGFLNDKQILIPIDDKIHLANLKISLEGGLLNLNADIEENEGSSIEVSSHPVWDPLRQYLQIEDVKFQTKSKNLILKSKGWLARLFLDGKLDKKIEEKANLLFSDQLAKIKKNPTLFPIPNTGNASVLVTDITIQELIFLDQAIRVKATIEGYWKLNLINVSTP
ncbi:MAG: DUF4403 family protein [Saprospiraceae bacterium]